ncbi:MAG: bifunctional phosphoribosylaminoimidazolecarboxamide formyltransferase/IMP cyclohydrolase [Myxococcota bacterium]
MISVTDKSGIVELARGLIGLGFEIVSTGGTRALLEREGIAAREVKDLTGVPEMLDGRVKTLHPKVHGGILARRDKPGHLAEMAEHGIGAIDVVCVNLYAFDQAAAKPGLAFDEVVEEIDIGGPALLRAAAKNHSFVLPLVDPADYPEILRALAAGEVSAAQRRALALKVFRHTSRYDAAIARWLESQLSPPGTAPETLMVEAPRAQLLRYGENPHQAAAVYRDRSPPPASLVGAKQLGGKELSFNNLLDADAALGLAMDLGGTTAVYVKHNNPCGVASRPSLAEAVKLARDVDPVSAFGAVIAVTAEVDKAAAEVLGETFVEVIVAPRFSPEAVEVLGVKKNLRLLELGPLSAPEARGAELRRIRGGWLWQGADVHPNVRQEVEGARTASKRAPTDAERRALRYAWTVAKHVRSNAIVFSLEDRVVAVGAGQMSRVDSVALCRMKAGEKLKGTVVASDAFFPFRDGVDLLAAAGATAIAQPGGSVRDDEVIQAADEHQVAMLLTGVRHFRH